MLLADEPTGELDTATASEVFEVLRRVNEQLGVTIVVVTHDPLVNDQVKRTIAIRDGRTSTETLRRRAVATDGGHEIVAEEYAVLDRVGPPAAATRGGRGARPSTDGCGWCSRTTTSRSGRRHTGLTDGDGACDGQDTGQ